MSCGSQDKVSTPLLDWWVPSLHGLGASPALSHSKSQHTFSVLAMPPSLWKCLVSPGYDLPVPLPVSCLEFPSLYLLCRKFLFKNFSGTTVSLKPPPTEWIMQTSLAFKCVCFVAHIVFSHTAFCEDWLVSSLCCKHIEGRIWISLFPLHTPLGQGWLIFGAPYVSLSGQLAKQDMEAAH